MRTAGELIASGERTLKAVGHRLARTGDEDDQAAELLEHVLGRKPRRTERVSPAHARRFEQLVTRRASGEPLPQIVGWIGFRGLRVPVRPGSFIPRPSSEFLAGEAIRRLPRSRSPVAVDLATGVGPIALSVAASSPGAEVHGVDISRTAVQHARANARALGLDATFHVGDLFGPLPARLHGMVDVITIHPPYVPRAEVATLPDEIKRYEPRHTLTDRSDDGLELVRRLEEEAPRWLRPDGWVLVETDATASRRVKSILRGYRDVAIRSDTHKITRVIAARRPRAD